MNAFETLIKIGTVEQGKGSASITVKVSQQYLNDAQNLHGGFIASILDSVSGYAGMSILPPGYQLIALQLSINFVRVISKGQIQATASVMRSGLQILHIESKLVNDDGLTVANACGVWLVQRAN
jgi:uncharacterized protein (TIGR00369 family)